MKTKFILILIIIVSLQFLGFKSFKSEKNIYSDSTKTITISLVGDLMCHVPQMDYARIKKDSFDFKPVFREIKKYLSVADLTIGNLETTLSGQENRYSGYPLFNSPDEFLDAIKDAGFDILITANNHTLDRGKKGILKTIDKINSIGLKSVGTYKTQHERDSVRIFDINGIKISIHSYTYGLNGNYISKNDQFMVCMIDTSLIKNDLMKAKALNVDLILVYFHFGEEYQRNPNQFQNKIVKFAIDNGADIIIGSHPHVIQSLEFFTSSKGKLKEGLIAYSLGNFISNQQWRYSDCGVILNIELTKNFSNNTISLSNLLFIPTWVYKGKTDNDVNEFIILPSDTSKLKPLPIFLSKTDRQELLQSYDDNKKLFLEIDEFKKRLMNQSAK